MRLKQLTVRNFGLYRGEQIFDFEPRTRRGKVRPIVLVGGHNGAGKTTLLDAVRLCLYGRLALGNRVTDTEYNAHLRERLHRGRDLLAPISYASVSLEFDYAHAGKRSTYIIQRAWETHGATGVSEYLRVQRDGKELAEVESQFWPEFVRSLVPIGVSQLFFFDGEKIKRLAEEESESETLAESIKALLGLDLVERLQADLDLYCARYLKKTATGTLATRLNEIDVAELQLKHDLAEYEAEEGLLKARKSEIAEQVDRAEQLLAQRGEGMSALRGVFHERRAELRARQEQVEKMLRELCDTSFPFSLCPTLGKELQVQLEAEAEHRRWETSRGEIEKALSVVTMRLTRGKFPRQHGWDAKTRVVLQDELATITKDLVELPLGLADTQQIHGLSEREREFVQHTLAASLSSVPLHAAQLSKELNLVVAELRDVQEKLNRAPEGDEIAPVVRQLSALQEEHAACALDLKLKTEQREKVERDIAAIVRERDRMIEAQKEVKTMAGRLALASAARRTLDDYLTRLTSAKVQELEKVVLECFRDLSRKTDLVHGLKIDPTTFNVTLFDANDLQIPKSSLSAGEKQIYAISLLWALAKVSGRPLPMIIDTPLARLDSIHRQHLLERYFPVASHQVIILSTDTEVDQHYFDTLRPHTSHSVHLVSHAGWTEVMPGYFWRETADAAASA